MHQVAVLIFQTLTFSPLHLTGPLKVSSASTEPEVNLHPLCACTTHLIVGWRKDKLACGKTTAAKQTKRHPTPPPNKQTKLNNNNSNNKITTKVKTNKKAKEEKRRRRENHQNNHKQQGYKHTTNYKIQNKIKTQATTTVDTTVLKKEVVTYKVCDLIMRTAKQYVFFLFFQM